MLSYRAAVPRRNYSSHNNIIKNNISLNKVYTLNLNDAEWGICGLVAVMRALHNPK